MKFRYDMHVHTADTSPCGKLPAEQVVKMHKEAGYTGIVITDHYFDGFFTRRGDMPWRQKVDDYLRGGRLAAEAGARHNLQVFQGLELRFSGSMNDYLVYGLNDAFLYENPALYALGLAGFRERIVGLDVLVFQAHPFRPGMDRPRPELLDGLEVFNGNNCHHSNDHLAEAMAQEFGMLRVSGSDFHERADLATGGIYLPSRPANLAELMQLLREGKQSIIHP